MFHILSDSISSYMGIKITKSVSKRSYIAFIIVSCIYVVVFLFQIHTLYAKTYELHSNELVKIDSVRMLSRAYSTKSRDIDFEGEMRKSFRIGGASSSAIDDFKELYDTMQMSSLVMKIATDQSGVNAYFDPSNRDIIKVYGLEIGNKSYISIERLNEEERKNRKSLLAFISLFYVAFLVISRMQKLKSVRLENTGYD